MVEGTNKKLCHEQRQAFIDCMYVHSRCVQAGRKNFKECMDEEMEAGRMHQDCSKLYREFLLCRSQIVPNDTYTHQPELIMIRWIHGPGFGDTDRYLLFKIDSRPFIQWPTRSQ